MTFHEPYVIIGSLSSAVIAGFILWQVIELRTTNKLAHSACIVPRQQQNRQDKTVAIFQIENIGTASAKNIH